MSAATSFNFLKLDFVRGNSAMTDTLHEHAKLVHLFIQYLNLTEKCFHEK
jgi:hypothetical protein